MIITAICTRSMLMPEYFAERAVAAHGQHLAAKAGLVQHDPANDANDEHPHEQHRDHADIAAAKDVDERFIDDGDRS